jgi:polyferredoxin
VSASATQQPELPRALQHRERCGTSRGFGGSSRAKWRWIVLALVHVAVLAHVAHWKIRGATLTPVEPSEAGQTLELGLVNAGFLLFVAATLVTLIVGRFFCGWVCHLVAYQDAAAWLLAKLKLRPRPIRSRLLMLVPAYAALDMFVAPTVARWLAEKPAPELTWHLTTNDLWERFPGPGMAALTLLVDGALLVWWLGAKGFCTYGCPYGAIFGLVDRAAPGRIRVTDACEGCGHCTAVCTSNVRVHEEVARYGEVVDSGCMKCTDCVSACPKDALYFGFSKSVERAAPALPARIATQRAWDFSWPEELALAALFAGALFAFRGLYGAVPFLLAIGLAVATALACVLGARALARRELRFQHTLWKRDGRLTASGGAGLACCAALAAFTAHAGWVNGHERTGTRALERAARFQRGSAERARELELAAERFADALGAGLFANATLLNKLGQTELELGRYAQAQTHLRDACALEPDWESAHVALADARYADQQRAQAAEGLLELLERRDSAAATARVAAAVAREEVALDRIAALGTHARARAVAVLERALSMRPDFDAARALLATLRSPES